MSSNKQQIRTGWLLLTLADLHVAPELVAICRAGRDDRRALSVQEAAAKQDAEESEQ